MPHKTHDILLIINWTQGSKETCYAFIDGHTRPSNQCRVTCIGPTHFGSHWHGKQNTQYNVRFVHPLTVQSRYVLLQMVCSVNYTFWHLISRYIQSVGDPIHLGFVLHIEFYWSQSYHNHDGNKCTRRARKWACCRKLHDTTWSMMECSHYSSAQDRLAV